MCLYFDSDRDRIFFFIWWLLVCYRSLACDQNIFHLIEENMGIWWNQSQGGNNYTQYKLSQVETRRWTATNRAATFNSVSGGGGNRHHYELRYELRYELSGGRSRRVNKCLGLKVCLCQQKKRSCG